MRKFFRPILICFIIFVAAACLSACNPTAGLPTVKITYIVNGDVYRCDEYDIVDFKFPPKPADAFYTFEGWFFDAEFQNEFTKFSDINDGMTEITVYAKRSPKKYSFIFYSNGETYHSQTFTDTTDFVFPSDPYREGYEFNGWFLENSVQISSKNIFEICPLPAKYELYAAFECMHASVEEIITEPTCKTDGKHIIRCLNCRENIDVKTLPSLGHIRVIDEAVKPTCTDKGLTQGEHCESCLEVFVTQTTLNALGHSYGDGVITLPATCEHTGILTFFCKRDECTHSYTQEIPSHTLGDWTTVKAGSCVEKGERVKSCTLCGLVIERETFAGNGHSLNEMQFDADFHWQICTLCEEAVSAPHSLNGADCCDVCPYFIPDTPAAGSIIKNLTKRIPISSDFINKPNGSSYALEMTVIDVAQGDSIFFRFPDGQTMLMDSGSVNFPIGNHYDRVKKVFDANGVKQLDYLFITHSDYDHVRYIEDVLKDFEVKNIYIPKLSDDSNGSTWKDTVKAISAEKYTENGVSVPAQIRYNIGDYEISGNGWRMRCHSYLSKDYPTVNGSSAYSPTATDADSDEIINSLSPICMLEYAGRTIVLTGDSNLFNEKYLIDRGIFKDIDADVLKVAHHGSRTSTTDKFLSAVKCEYAIISYGTNIFGHPTEEVLNRLLSKNIQRIFRTKEDGNIKVAVNGKGTLSIEATNSNGSDITDNYPIEQFICSYSIQFVTVSKRKFI